MRFSDIKLISATCAAVFTMAAHAASLPVGFSYGELAATGLSKVGKATVSGAVVLPAEKLSKYAGAKVTAVRVGLVTADGVNNLTGWVRSSLEGENLDEAAAEAAAPGWNTIALGGNLEVGDAPLVVGFSFEQTSGVKCISVVGDNNDDARWIAKNGKWELAKNRGVLSLELVVSGDNLPSRDIEICGIGGSKLPSKAGEPMEIDVTVRNASFDDIAGFDILYDVDSKAGNTIHDASGLAYGEKATVKLTLSDNEVTPDKACMLKINAECEGDNLHNNDEVLMPVGSYTDSFKRRVLIEEFTTEECPNCPRAINTLKQCEEAGYGDRMTVVAHHVGFYTDFLTVEEDKDYLWFFDPNQEKGTFAPAVMLDRVIPEGSDVPVRSIGYFDTFESTLQEAIAIPAFVNVNASLLKSDDADNSLVATIDIEKMPLLDVCTLLPKLTVYLIEDKIPMQHQAGISSNTFTHSHVYRKCLSDLWGDPIQWCNHDGGHAVDHLEYTVEIDPEWNVDNMSVVAFVHEYDREDISKCEVFNTGVAAYGTIPTGVETASADAVPTEVKYTTLTGMNATSATSGILIKTIKYSDGSIKTLKEIRK